MTEDQPNENIHYLSHHPVIRKTAETTKLRIVFDASAKVRKDAPSLNDCLHVGPPLAPLMFDVLVRSREHKVALVGDIQKAFLQIEVNPEDRNYLRFLWVKNVLAEEPEVEIFRFCRVIFGCGPSPFLLNGTLRHHFSKYADDDPQFVRKMRDGLYVDDLVSGGKTVKEAFELYRKTRIRLTQGGFSMHKWKSNDMGLMAKINTTHEENVQPHDDNDVTYAKSSLGNVRDAADKVLGIFSNKSDDTLKFNLEEIANYAAQLEVTKRNVLSTLAKVFDPLGVISPLILPAKTLFQEICVQQKGWDEQLDGDLRNKWKLWLNDMKKVNDIILKRCLYQNIHEETLECWLHGFGDASKKAFCENVYLVYQQTSGVYSSLITAKPRVAPVKTRTIPRLELMSARILTTLTNTVRSALESLREIRSTTLWLDSKTVLYWLRNRGEWKQFVKHRVDEILAHTAKDQWKYCPTFDNPADIGTRGTNGSKLKDSSLWWCGPKWLTGNVNDWPEQEQIGCTEEVMAEGRPAKVQMATVSIKQEAKFGVQMLIDITRFSKEIRLYRVTAWVYRFLFNVIASKKEGRRTDSELTTQEIVAAQKLWIKSAQDELSCESKFEQVVNQLGDVKDQDGIYRCHGRLKNSDLEQAAKQPILLPQHHILTTLIVEACHKRILHGGVRETLAELRSKYWICKGRQRVKKILRSCTICRTFLSKPFRPQAPGMLPGFRVKRSSPFANTGVDFAGPLYIKDGKGMRKAYIGLFRCSVTRAIHLELVGDLSAPTFILALRRFSSRRGMPSLMISDNAKTLKATAKWLKKLYATSQVRRYLQENRVNWRFNLELAPWWGGFYERLVGSVKRTLRKVLGNARLNYQELETVLIEIEGNLNNRPMTYEYEELGEETLTPAHLLYGRRLATLPDEHIEKNNDDLKGRLEYLTQRLNHFWNRWQHEYLVNLREYHKSNVKSGKVIEENDVVLLYEDHVPRGKWKMAKVIQLIPSKDGIVRGVKLQVGNVKGKISYVKRPIEKLYPLEIEAKERHDQNAAEQIDNLDGAIIQHQRQKRAAALDADWCRKKLDQSMDQID